MEIKSSSTVFCYDIFDYPVIWGILDLVNLKSLFVLPRDSGFHDLLWKIVGIFFICRTLFLN